MSSASDCLALAAALGSGLVAGLCFAFASFLMRSFDDLEPSQAIRVMQSLNGRILRSSAMVVWFGTLLVGGAAAALAEERAIPTVATVLYGIAAVGITGGGNVPLNEALDRVDPEGAEAAAAWQDYFVRWGRWNALRTALCALATVGFAMAARCA